MAINRDQINFDIKFRSDESGLNKIKQSLSEIKKLTRAQVLEINPELGDIKKAEAQLKEIRDDAVLVEKALEKAFNKDLGTLNIAKFNRTLKDSGKGLNDVYRSFTSAGAAGQSAFRNITAQVLTTNMQLKQSHTLLDKMAETMANTVKWGIASSVMNTFTGSVQKAYGYVKNLDSSLNDIRIVTGKSAEEMDAFAVKANKAAKALGQSTRNYTDASLIYYQQGLAEQDVQARAETTLKAANVTGQSGEAVSEQLTAVWNGYKVSASEAELYVDKLAAVAASTATDLEELSVGMSKVASAAATMGVDIDQLNGHLATVISVTRQAPESVGTAFKTIYARMSDLKLGGTDEDGLGLGDVSGTMEAMGVQVLDQTGNLRDMGEVMEDVAAKWDTWTEAQKTAMAQVMAGKRQYNNLMALFENWDMYEEAVNTSANAMGTLQNQQDIYMESTEAHLQGLSTSMEDLYDSLLDNDTINGVADALAGLADLAGNFVDAIGGGQGVLLNFGSIATRVFSKNIAEGISTFIGNIKKARENTKQLNAQLEFLQNYKGADLLKDDDVQKLVTMKKEMLDLGKIVTEEQHNQANSMIQMTGELKNQQVEWDNTLKKASNFISKIDGKKINIKGVGGDSTEGLDNLAQAEEKLEKLNAQIQKAENKARIFQKALNLVARDLVEINEEGNDLPKHFERLPDRVRKTTKEMEDLADTLTKLGFEETSIEIRNALATFDEAMKNGGEDWFKTTDAQEQMNKLYSIFNKGIGVIKKGYDDAEGVIKEESLGKSLALEEAISKANKKWREFVNNLKTVQVIKGFVDIAASVGQVAGAIQTLSSIGDIFSDDSLSGGEKALQIISALAMALPQLISGLGGLSSAIIKVVSTLFPSIIATNTDTASKHANAIAAKAAAIANKIFGESFTKLLIPILLVTAAITALIAIITLLINAWNADANAAKRAAAAAESAAEAYDKVAASAKKVKDTLDQLEESEKTLKTLKRGTEEWLEVVNQTNEALLGLLDTYPQLAQYMENVNGQLVLSDEGKQWLKETSEQQTINAQNAKYAAAADAAEKKNTSEITDYAREKWIGRDSVEKAVEAINQSGSGFLKSAESIQEALGVGKSVAEALYKNRDSLLKLAATVDNNNKAQELYYDQIAENNMGEDEIYKMNETFQQDYKDAYSSELQRKTEELYENKYKDKGKLGFGIWDEDVQKQYAELIGATKVENKGDNKGTYTIDGEEVEIEDEVARWALALEEASGALGNFTKDITLATKNIVTSDNKKEDTSTSQNDGSFQRALMTFAGGSEGDLSALSNLQLVELEDVYKSWEITDEQAEALGWESAAKLIDAITEAINAEKETREEQLANTTEEAESAMSLKFAQDSAMATDDSKAFMQDLGAFGEMGGASELIANSGVDLSEYVNMDWNRVFEKIDFSTIPVEELEAKFGEAFQNAIDSVEKEDLENALYEQNLSEDTADFGFDKEQYEDLTEMIQETAEASDELSDELKDNSLAAQQIAKDLLRYDKALESVQEHSEDWLHVLDNGTLQEQSEIIDDLAEAYGNMFDIDPSTLSKGFLTSADNLRLMQQAANGSEEAYNQLQAAVQQDIMVKAGIDKTKWDADFNDLMNKYYQGQNLEDIEAGARLDNAQFLQGLTDMVNAAGLTAEQATSLLSSMGIDAEVTENTTEGTETNQVADIEAQVSSETVPGSNPATGEPTEFSFPSVIHNIVKKTVDTPKQNKSFGLKVTSASKSSGGGFKFKNATHGGGSKGPSGGGGGGGGSGGGSTPKYTKKDKYKPKKDRYRQVNIELDDLARRLEKLNNEQERLFGSDLSKNLEDQLDILKKQVEKTKEKIALAKEEKAELQTELGEYGIKFDAEGDISNYEDLINAKDNELKNLTEQWNAGSAEWQESEAGKEFDEKLKEKEKELDELLGLIEDYDTLIYKTIPDMNDEILDAAYQEIDLQVEKFNIEAELRLDLTDAIKDWKDFERDVLLGLEEDDFSGLAESYVNEYKDLWGSGLGENLSRDINDIMGSINNINSDNPVADGLFVTYDGNGNLVTDEVGAMEALEEKQKQLMEHLTDLKETEKEVHELYLDSVDAVGEAYEAQVENFEFINDQLEHSLNMIELLKGETAEAYEAMGEVFAEQAKNYESMLATQKDSVDYYKQMMDAETDPEAKEKWAELWKDAVQDLNSTVADAIENLNNQYQNSINQAIKEMDNALGGTKKKAEWEIALKKDENYLDEVNRMFETQSFENKVKDSINNTDSLSAQKRLNKLLDEELTKLKEKDKLTQYDIDRANQMYEIELKKIALEEAQQNKSKMRLRRDSSGNYSYQFVADEDAQADAQRELDEAQNSLYNMDKDAFREKQEEFYSTWEEYQEKMREYSELSHEERLAREEEFQEWFDYYENRMVELTGESNSIKQNLNQSTYDSLASLYSQDETNFANMTEAEKQSLIDNLQPEFARTKNMIDADENSLKSAYDTLHTSIDSANLAMKNGVDAVAKAIGVNGTEGLTKTVSDAAKTIKEDFIPKQQDIINKTKTTVTEVGNWKKEVDKVKKSYEDTYKVIEKALKESQKLREEQYKQEAEKEKAKKTGTTTTTKKTTTTTPKTETKKDNKKETEASKIAKDATELIKKVHTGVIGGPNGWQGPAKTAGYSDKAIKVALTAFNNSKDGDGYDYNYQQALKLVGLDTGGYTGKWNSKEGKIAMLHEKELVLNKNDTENMLKMISMVREIMGLGSQISTLDTSNEDKSTKAFHDDLSNLINSVNNFRDEYLYEQEVDSLSLLQKFEELRQGLDKNEQIEELLRIEDYNNRYQEMLNEERKQEMEVLLNRLIAIEKENGIILSNSKRKEIDVLEKSISNSLTELKHVIKDSFESKIDKINSIFNNIGGGGGGGRPVEDLKQNTVINIHADFPDVSSAKEIQLAFDNLVNIASQRAYSTSALRKK